MVGPRGGATRYSITTPVISAWMPKLRKLTAPPASSYSTCRGGPLQWCATSAHSRGEIKPFQCGARASGEDENGQQRQEEDRKKNGKLPATPHPKGKELRSQLWFDNPDNPGMTALYLERYMNFGLTPKELRSGKPIIGIAQTGSDLSPCNRHHLELASRVREGIRAAGGIAFEFPVHPIQETGKRPTAALDRNLAYLGLVEILYGYPLDGVVLMTGCDKTTPACIMAAATVNIPAIVLSGGPMLNGWWKGERCGSGMAVWKAREELAAGRIDQEEFVQIAAASAPSVGHCNTMGTASTMNALAEALGMSLPGCAAIPAPYKERAQIAYETGLRAVEIVWEDLKPSDILTREAFENTIMANSAIGGSTNAPIHINAIARHIGVKLTVEDWETVGLDIPLLVNMQPAGKYLGEEYYRAGGLPAVMNELRKAGKLHEGALTVNGKTMGENVKRATIEDADVIRTYKKPMLERAGFKVLSGNLFDSRDHEALGDLGGIPQPLPDQSEGPDGVRGQGRRVRRSGGLSPPHRRSEAQDRRAHDAVHPRRRADRLSGLVRSREHAAAGGADQKGHHVAALHRRRAAVRHLGLAVDPERVAGSGGGRRACAAQDGRPRAHRSQQRHGEHPDLEGGARRAPRRAAEARRLRVPEEPDAVAGNPARDGRPARRGHGAEAGGEISEGGAV